MVAAPPPEGFGIKTHLTSLRRFHARARACFDGEITAAPLELLPEPGCDPIALDKLTATALRQFAVEMARVQERDTGRFGTVSRWISTFSFRHRIYTTQDQAIDQFLTEHGAALSQSRALQRYNRVPAEPGELVLTPLQKAQPAATPQGRDKLPTVVPVRKISTV